MSKVILVHGMNADLESWNTVPDLLRAKGREVEAPTLPGHDKPVKLQDIAQSGTHASGLTMGDYVEEVAAAFPAGKARDVALVGHSMGGAVISHVAARHPDRIAKLVYVAAMLPDTGQSAAAIIDASQKAGAGSEETFAYYARFLDLLRFVKQPVEPLGEIFTRSPAFDALPKAYILCEKDGVIPPKVQKDMLDAYSSATTPVQVVMLDRGHLPQFEDPEELSEEISALLPA